MTTNSKTIELTDKEIDFLRLAVLAAEREVIHKGGSRDYDWEDQCESMKAKLRDLKEN